MKKGLLAICCSALIISSISLAANAPKPQAGEENFHLVFIQSGEEMLLKKNPRNDKWTLAIVEMDPSIAYYSEAPVRLAGKVDVNGFIKDWEGSDILSPSDGVIAEYSHKDAQGTNQQRRVLLSNPRYHVKTNTMIYDVEPVIGSDTLTQGKHIDPVLFVYRY